MVQKPPERAINKDERLRESFVEGKGLVLSRLGGAGMKC